MISHGIAQYGILCGPRNFLGEIVELSHTGEGRVKLTQTFFEHLSRPNGSSEGFAFFWEAPQRRDQPKNDHPWLPMTPAFYCKILFYYNKAWSSVSNSI